VLISQIPGSDGPSLESATDDLGRLLTTVETPMQWGDVSRLVEDMGCEPQEAQEVISGLVDDRILICM
jgi:hypothetical protein